MQKQLAVTMFLSLAALSQTWAQSVAGQSGISGTVHDASGAFVPNAKVAISTAGRGQVRATSTNSAGVFAAPALIPGSGYEVTVTASGFATYEAKDIALGVGQNVDLNISLAVGQTATTVEVSAAAQLLEDTKSDVSQAIGTREIMDLPTNGRRVDSFVLLTPGVSNDATFGLLTFRGVAGNNSFLLDGNDNTEQFYDENAGRTRIQSQISQDAVQEFQVVSANFSAEYGRAMGGVVNTVTKSGSNAVHGSAFYFLRSTGFDARDPYASFNPSEHRVQTGGTVGGPIVKNKLFYFLSADITRRDFPMVDSQVKAGVLDPVNQVWLGCGAPATPAQCAAINQVLPRFYGQIPRIAKNDLYFGRLDYNLSDRNTFSASFNFLRWFSPNGIQTGISSTTGAAVTGNGDDAVTVRNGKATWTFVPNGSLVNTFRYGLDTDRQGDGFDQAELGTGLRYLDVTVAGVSLGPASYLPRVEPLETRNEFADDVSWTKGEHILKFGGNFVNTQDDVNYMSNRFGTYTYLTATAFAEDYSGNTTGTKDWSGYSQTFGNPIVNYWIREFGLYAQDQWRASDRLTVTLGVRYEHSAVQQPSVVNSDCPQTGVIHTGPLDFMPRIGLAYRATDKTVFRAGYGTFFARMVGGVIDNLYTGNGIYQITDSLSNTNPTQLAAGPAFPNVLGVPPAGASVAASTLQFAAPNLKTPYSEQATLALEHELGKDLVVTLSGIWSRGVSLYGVTDLNAPAPSTTFTYKIDDANGNQVGTFATPVYLNPRPNTKYGAIYEVTNGVSSYYDGLTVTLDKRLSHGFQSLLSYTLSHEIDDGQGAATNAIFFSSLATTYNGNYWFEKGSGLLDQRHRLVFSFVWTPPSVRSENFFAKYFVNNWQLSSITTLASGRPTGSATIRTTDTAVPGMLSSSVIDGLAGGSTRVPFLPVDGIYTPPSYREDLRLTKIVPSPWESVKVYLSGEAFNISNSWSPTSMTTQEYTEAKGVLTLTPSAYGVGSADGGFPDGTQARRLQISARIVF
jgi:outer membrane receptor protein involved in Fe transport